MGRLAVAGLMLSMAIGCTTTGEDSPVVVRNPVTAVSVVVPAGAMILDRGASARLEALVVAPIGAPLGVRWSSSDPTRVAVNDSGVVTMSCAGGGALITARAVADTTRSAMIRVDYGSLLLPIVALAQVNTNGKPATLGAVTGVLDVVASVGSWNVKCDGTLASLGLSLIAGTDTVDVASAPVSAADRAPATVSFNTTSVANGDYRLLLSLRSTAGARVPSTNTVAITIANR